MDILRRFRTRLTPQRRRADPRQVRNSAGGFTFELDDVARLRRFLTLGTDGGTYYVDAPALTVEDAEVVLRLAGTDHATLVDTVVEVSESGRAPRQQPALFALAIAASHGTAEERGRALAVLPRVARTGTHLLTFAGYVEQFRGWGRSLRRAVGDWYLRPDVDAVAHQVVKYRSRGGWSHRDLLRLAHPAATEPARRALFEWIVRGTVGDDTPSLVTGHLAAHEPDADVPALVAAHRLGWETLPDEALTRASTWAALLDAGLPQTALLRQLPRLTRLGLLEPGSAHLDAVLDRLTDPERLRRARVHPVSVLVAARTYAAGRSARGAGTWEPVPQVVDALDAAFHAAFGAVEPAGRRTLLALDVSGSMGARISGLPLSCREASAALALVTAATEPSCEVVGFTAADGRSSSTRARAALRRLDLGPRRRLADAVHAVGGLPFGATDCAQPMLWALDQGREVETFVVYTDNETWHGEVHPHQALRRYRERTGIDARLVVVGMTATRFSIADPTDAGMLDVAGFDAAVPALVSDFSAGR
ncbi:TROVE domain-containing protein [Nocardioides marinquilinus]|uniref:TROVE domain-containing protein n=1 Tax=Nocardioides marinquilinus TaxID=1210400 RepID=A0ABP9Q641_9ACTN